MFRLSNMADYALVLLSYVARASEREGERSRVMTARDLAAVSRLPAPTVSKVLKRLARATLLESRRGVGGGYTLARPAAAISIAEVVRALDGPVALTRCTAADGGGGTGDHVCALLATCPTRAAWAPINRTVTRALAGLSLQDVRREAWLPPATAARAQPRG